MIVLRTTNIVITNLIQHNMKRKNILRIWLSLAMLMFIGNKVYAQVVYMVLSNNNITLTFYYDNNRNSRNGIFMNDFPYVPLNKL